MNVRYRLPQPAGHHPLEQRSADCHCHQDGAHSQGVADELTEGSQQPLAGQRTRHNHQKDGQRLMNMLATQTFLNRYVADHGGLPPQIAALLRDFAAQDL